MNALTIPEKSALLHTFEDMERMAGAVAKSGLFGMKNSDQALALMLVAQAEGQHPATITQEYDIIQGRAARKSHSVLARFQAAGGKVEWHELTHQKADASFSHPQGGTVRLDWTMEMAVKAKLAGKDNWVGYSRAMLRARVIAEGVRAVYPAALGGMLVAEEAQDLPANPSSKDMGAADVVTPPPPPPPAPTWPQEKFEKQLAGARKAIEGGKPADDVIATMQTKGLLTEEQKATLRSFKAKADVQDAEVKPANDAPSMTYAQVMEKLQAAQNLDQLDDAGAFIGAVANPEHRAELAQKFDDIRATLA